MDASINANRRFLAKTAGGQTEGASRKYNVESGSGEASLEVTRPQRLGGTFVVTAPNGHFLAERYATVTGPQN